jgi:Glycosyltransferases involved in cell wall biogenesis
MERIILSIIVPVYNSAGFLRRCLDSILDTVEEDFEVILVDDGSVDGSSGICEEYKERFSGVRVIHQANSGVSVARNRGLEEARGEYVWFCDSDDRVVPGSLSILRRLIGDRFPEMIVFPVVQEDELERKIGLIPPPCKTAYPEFGALQCGDFLYPVARVFKRSLANGLYFDPTLKLMEDRKFLYSLCERLTRDIEIVQSPLYAYCVTHPSSAVNSSCVSSYIDSNDVQYEILQKEIKAGRPNPAFRLYISNTLGVLSLISKKGEGLDKFEGLRDRMLSVGKIGLLDDGKLELKYCVCKTAPLLFKVLYRLKGKIERSESFGSTVLEKNS